MREQIMYGRQERSFNILELLLMNARFTITTAMLLLMIVGVPVVYASQNSVPGDILYGFEIHVVEELEGHLQFTSDDRVNFSTQRLQERLREFGEVRGEENAALLVRPIVQQVREHAEEALNALQTIDERNARLDDLVELSAIVEAHVEVLNEFQENSEVGVEDAALSIAYELQVILDQYADASDPEAITATLREEINDIESLSRREMRDDVKDEVALELEEITEALTDAELVSALNVATDLEVELRKQQYIDSIRDDSLTPER